MLNLRNLPRKDVILMRSLINLHLTIQINREQFFSWKTKKSLLKNRYCKENTLSKNWQMNLSSKIHLFLRKSRTWSRNMRRLLMIWLNLKLILKEIRLLKIRRFNFKSKGLKSTMSNKGKLWKPMRSELRLRKRRLFVS